MKCHLEISAAYSGENSNISGNIEVPNTGRTHRIMCSGSASERGMTANVDGETYWWCGGEENESGTRDIEEAVDEAYEDCWKQVEELGFDVEGSWTAVYVDGEVISVTEHEDIDE
jgi:hypothetical protein